MKGNGVNPTPGRPIYRGVHRIYLLQLLPSYNTPQRLYPEMFTRRLRWIFRQTDYGYDLNLSLGHQPNKKITSGRPDGKHVLQAPTSQ
jgi:hypothetical protein